MISAEIISILEARRETFLARYPRKLKLAATCVVIALIAAAGSLSHHHGAKRGQTKQAAEIASMAGTQAKAKADDAVTASGNADDESQVAESPANSTAISASAMQSNDTDDRGARMAHAPDAGLTEDTSNGGLPRIGEDGRKPWQVYARPFNTVDTRPRVSIVVSDLGLSHMATDAALQRLPASVTLAFDAQSAALGAWLARARQDGHETLISVPMEPFDYPRSDPGPNTLLSNLPNSDNIQRLNVALRQGTGYVGITTFSGSRLTADPDKIAAIMEALARRGLLVFDARVAPHSVVKDIAKSMKVPVAVSSLQIDANPNPDAIDAALAQLEQTARASGHAVGVATSLPITLDRLDAWIKKLHDNGLVLAPLSAVVE